MQTVLDTRFEGGRLPPGWFDERQEAAFIDGRLHSGKVCRPTFPLPDGAWQNLRVQVWVQCQSHSAIEFGSERVMVLLNMARGRHAVTAHNGKTLAANLHPLACTDALREVVFTFDRGRWVASVDGQPVIEYQQPTGDCVAGLMSLVLCADCVVHRICVSVDGRTSSNLQPPQPDPQRDFHLEVTVDFPDDLHYAPYTQAMLDQLFADYAAWGVRRCHWIYDDKDNWWNYFAEPGYANYLKTKDNLGGDIFKAAVEAAHRQGIELYGMFKPFEMGYMLNTFGEGTPEAKQRGRFNRIGGVISRCSDYPIQHRELLTCRKPGAFGPAENDVWTRIDLIGDQPAAAAFTSEQIRLFISDDNNTYRAYDGPMNVEEIVEPARRVMRLTNLALDSPFVAVAVPGSAVSFGNTLGNLLRVYGNQGEESRMTLGVIPRAGKVAYDIKTAMVSDSRGLDFCRFGIEFDNIAGTPTSCLTGYDAMREWHALDGKHGFVGIARGKDRETVAVMSPAYKQTRDWWLQWVRDILEAGADGVEMRVRNHHTHMQWSEFGFEAPVRDEFLKRHGVDIWATDDFDRAAWRRLRGEHFTQFYREAREMVNAFGRKMGLHISRTMDIEPEQAAAMDIHLDWRTWLDEGLADSVTAKEVVPGTVFANEILSHTRGKNIPVIYSRYANGLWRHPNGTDVCAHRIQLARDYGFGGFQFYESCAVMRARTDGSLIMEQPELADLFRRQFNRDATP